MTTSLLLSTIDHHPDLDRLAELELALDTELPAAYRELLLTCNGGPIDGTIDVPGRGTATGFCFFPIDADDDADDLLTVAAQERWRLPEGLLPIARDARDHMLALVVRGRQRGSVYHVARSRLAGHRVVSLIAWVADDLSEVLGQLGLVSCH